MRNAPARTARGGRPADPRGGAPPRPRAGRRHRGQRRPDLAQALAGRKLTNAIVGILHGLAATSVSPSSAISRPRRTSPEPPTPRSSGRSRSRERRARERRLGQSLEELMELKERLHHQAFHDALTGLPNRALFVERVAAALDRARSRRPSTGRPSSCSISTTSRSSTTPGGTPPGTTCWSGSPTVYGTRSGPSTRPRGWGVTSSASSSRTGRPKPARSPPSASRSASRSRSRSTIIPSLPARASASPSPSAV